MVMIQTKVRGQYRKTLEKVPEILSMRKDGKSIKDIAEILHISNNTVKSILNPNSKINTLGATSKILRLMIACANEAINNVEKQLKSNLEDFPDAVEDVYLETWTDYGMPEGMILTINSWLEKLDQME